LHHPGLPVKKENAGSPFRHSGAHNQSFFLLIVSAHPFLKTAAIEL
jgi:hypothetical protein